jgi:hypothetical protein
MHCLNKRVAVLLGGFILALAFAAPLIIHASEWDLETKFMVNQQFQVPGKVLDPNTQYVMRLLDSPGTRNVVQIFNSDQTQLLTEFLAIRAERLQREDKTVFTFYETQPGYPKPMRRWFYPARNAGLEFIYPKEQMTEITAHFGVVQPTATASLSKEPVAEPEPAIKEPEAKKEEAAVQPSEPEPVTEAPAEQPSAVAENLPPELPKTAGELPLFGIMGLLFLGSGLGLRVGSTKS